jgi:hypothetical protein
MTPREIIAKGLFNAVQRFGQSECGLYAGHAIEALHSAGYRILGPGEWDKETVEKCAEVVREMVPNIPPDGPSTDVQESEYMALGHALTAIRALAKEKQGC